MAGWGREGGEPRVQGLSGPRGESTHEHVVGTELASALASKMRLERSKEGMVKFH